MGKPVLHFEIMTHDGPALRTFYEDVFAWTFDPPAPGAKDAEYATVTTNEHAGIGGGIGTAPAGYAGHVTFYIAVPDAAKALADVEARGGSKLMGPEPVPGGPIIGLFRDPQGNTIGVVQRR